MATPCDFGGCPYGAQYSEDCRYHCGLGVDDSGNPEEEYEEYNAFYGHDDDDFDEPCATNRDYSPSNPWDAPGMKVSDFI